MASDSSRDSLPFEPKGKRKKTTKAASSSPQVTTADNRSTDKAVAAKPSKQSSADASIPEVVSRRMFRRMIVFSGTPTALGVAIFFLSYFLLVREILDFPKVFVLLSTLGCFGLGVVGLTYGALSASWDEDRLGSWWGMDEFRTNFGRMSEAWRASRKQS